MQENFLQQIGPQIKVANTLIERLLNQRMAHMFADYHLTGAQSMVLVSLYEAHGKPVIQKELADQFVLSHPTLRSIVRRLEQAELVQTATLASDRRQVALTLSAKGTELLQQRIKQIYAIMDEVNREIEAQLSKQDIAQLQQALTKIIQHLK